MRVGWPFRPADEIPEGTDRATAKGLVTRAIMGRIAELLPPRQRGATGRLKGRKGTPCDNRIVGTVQEVRIAKRTGFCYGVREAIDKAKEASAAGKPTHTLGPGRPQRGRRPRPPIAGDPDRRDPRRCRSWRGRRHPRPRRSSRRHGPCRRPRPGGHRRHVHVGHPGAEGAPEARRGRLHDRPAGHAEASRGRRIARVRARTRSSSTRKRSGTPPSRVESGWR